MECNALRDLFARASTAMSGSDWKSSKTTRLKSWRGACSRSDHVRPRRGGSAGEEDSQCESWRRAPSLARSHAMVQAQINGGTVCVDSSLSGQTHLNLDIVWDPFWRIFLVTSCTNIGGLRRKGPSVWPRVCICRASRPDSDVMHRVSTRQLVVVDVCWDWDLVFYEGTDE